MPRSRYLSWLCLVLLIAPRVHAQTSQEAFAALTAAVDEYLDKDIHQRFTYITVNRSTSSTVVHTPSGLSMFRTQDVKKYEYMDIGGQPYARLMEVNGKPLSGDAEKHEQELYDKAANDHAGLSLTQRYKETLHVSDASIYSFHLPLEDLMSKFSMEYRGTKTIDGVRLLHFHGTTLKNSNEQPDPVPSQEIDIWVDPLTKSLVRADHKLLVDNGNLLSGTTSTKEFFLVDGVTCLSRNIEHFVLAPRGIQKTLDGDTMFTDYKKFSSTTKILPDTETVVP
jgi:hypothetical protein